jgi:predicted O-methyltransferase YrrM
MRISQHEKELSGLINLLSIAKPKIILEIGVDQGGTFRRWCELAGPGGLVIGIDRDPRVRQRVLGSIPLEARRIITGDTKERRTIEDTQAILRGRPVDFLFIDGDHSYEGVRSDYENFSPLVRPGGMIALHDIATPETTRNPYKKGTRCGVIKFWAELKTGSGIEFIDPAARPPYGIGVITKNGR